MTTDPRWITAENLGEIAAVKGFRQLRTVLNRRGAFTPAAIEEPVEEILGFDQDRKEDEEQLRAFPILESVEAVRDPDRPWFALAAPLPRTEDHVFRLFLDGSLRTYRWGEKTEGGTSFPVIVTEVGCAVVHRQGDGTIRRRAFRRRLCLLVPPTPPVSTDTAEDLATLATASSEAPGLGLEIVHLARERHAGSLRTALLGKARSIMHELEVKVAESLPREESEWMIVDGAIRKGIFMSLKNCIGVAKSFSRNPRFVLPPAHRSIDVTALLRELPCGARSPVFIAQERAASAESATANGIASWYVRLREPVVAGDPLHGIVKVDYITRDGWNPAHDAPIADRLSRALLAERSVSPYPVARWATHIYPVFCAETYLKSSLLSPIIMRGLMEA